MPNSHPWLQKPPAQWLDHSSSPHDVHEVTQFLKEQGTFHFPSLPNGLFSAAAGDKPDFELTGYQNVWLRDNIHVAWSLWDRRRAPAQATRCVQSLLQFYRSQHPKLLAIINGSADPAEVHNRPHIRFDGPRLSELAEKWPHAQNDALGYLLWLSSSMIENGSLQPEPTDWQTLALLVHFFAAIRVWQDEDSGHWEENRKIAASSIGPVCAGLESLLRLLERQPAAARALAESTHSVTIEEIRVLLNRCRVALREILPLECRQNCPSQFRAHDAALLFLIYPLNQVENLTIENQILDNVAEHLTGPIGIRRYKGDSYWCNDYRQKFTAELRSSDFSEDISNRDQLLQPGFEAQWCLFDPILSCIHGRRYQSSGQPHDLAKQITAIQRSLGQLTRPSDRFPPYRCPESWFCEQGEWIPNDITPLLWTQANLLQALDWLQDSLRLRAKRQQACQ